MQMAAAAGVGVANFDGDAVVAGERVDDGGEDIGGGWNRMGMRTWGEVRSRVRERSGQ